MTGLITASQSGPIEGQHVVSARQAGSGDGEVRLFQRGVETVVVDDRWASPPRVIHQVEVARKGGLLIGDRHALKTEPEQWHRREERVPAARREQSHLRVTAWVIAAEELGGAVVVRCSHQCFTGTDTVTIGQRLSPQLLDALGGGLPLAMPTGLVAVGDGPRGHQYFAEVCAAVIGEAGRTQCLE